MNDIVRNKARNFSLDVSEYKIHFLDEKERRKRRRITFHDFGKEEKRKVFALRAAPLKDKRKLDTRTISLSTNAIGESLSFGIGSLFSSYR